MTRRAAGAPELAEFAGRWRLSRRIEDSLAGQTLTAEGHVTFSPGDGGLVYDEDTRLRLPDGREMTGRRRYLWRADERGGIAVLFEDGRPFHRIAPGEPCPQDSHDCAPDTYLGGYDFSDWPVFRVRWEVSGPRKNYRMDTLFRRDA